MKVNKTLVHFLNAKKYMKVEEDTLEIIGGKHVMYLIVESIICDLKTLWQIL